MAFQSEWIVWVKARRPETTWCFSRFQVWKFPLLVVWGFWADKKRFSENDGGLGSEEINGRFLPTLLVLQHQRWVPLPHVQQNQAVTSGCSERKWVFLIGRQARRRVANPRSWTHSGVTSRGFMGKIMGEGCRVCDGFMHILLIGRWWGDRDFFKSFSYWSSVPIWLV